MIEIWNENTQQWDKDKGKSKKMWQIERETLKRKVLSTKKKKKKK